jgi:hypothetical protein
VAHNERGDAPQEDPVQVALAVGAKHDEIDLQVAGELEDLTPRMALLQVGGDPDALALGPPRGCKVGFIPLFLQEAVSMT